MPIPVIAWLGSLALAGGAPIARAQLKHALMRNRPAIEKWAMGEALKALGLPDLLDERLTRESFTQSLNKNFLASAGVELTNVFDADATKKDFERIAIARVAQAMDVPVEGHSPRALTEAMRKWVENKVVEEMGKVGANGEGSEVLAQAKDVLAVVALVRSVRKELDANGMPVSSAKRPLLMTPEAINNRERQARYRAKHKKVWVSK